MAPTKKKPTRCGQALGMAQPAAAMPWPKGNPGATGGRRGPLGLPRQHPAADTAAEGRGPRLCRPLSPPPARTPRRRTPGASLRTQSGQGAAAQPAGRPREPRGPARTGLVVQRDLDVGDVAEGDEGGVQHLLVHLLRQPACGRHRVSAETPPRPPRSLRPRTGPPRPQTAPHTAPRTHVQHPLGGRHFPRTAPEPCGSSALGEGRPRPFPERGRPGAGSGRPERPRPGFSPEAPLQIE